MTTCLGKSYSFGSLCMSFVNVYQLFCVFFFPFWFIGWDWIVFIPVKCLSITFLSKVQSTLVISTSVISNNRLSRRENLVLV